MPSVAIVGPGAIGCACAELLQRTGRHRLTLCARRATPGPIVVERAGEPPLALDAPLVTNPADAPRAVDLVVLAVKAHQTASAAPWLRALCGTGTLLAVLQNGVEHRERVAPFAGGADVLPVVVQCVAAATSPGRISVASPLRMTVERGPLAERFASMLEGSGAALEVTDDFATAQWSKLCWNAVSGLMAAAARPGVIFRDERVRALAHRLALECVRVARAEGARLDDAFADDLAARFAALPPDRSNSILADRLAGRPLEWDARNAVVQRLGARHGIPTPVSDVLVPILIAASGDAGSR